MDHHGRVHVLEEARVQEVDLAAASFLRRCAQHDDREVEFGGDRGESNARTHRGGRDDVVTARVADVGQRVVLGAEHHVQAPRPVGRAKGGGQTGHAAFEAEAGLL